MHLDPTSICTAHMIVSSLLSLQSIAMLEAVVLHSCYPVLRTLHAMPGAGSAVHVLRRTDCTGAE